MSSMYHENDKIEKFDLTEWINGGVSTIQCQWAKVAWHNCYVLYQIPIVNQIYTQMHQILSGNIAWHNFTCML